MLFYFDFQTQDFPLLKTRFLSSCIKVTIDTFLVVWELWNQKVIDFVPCVGNLIDRKCQRTAGNFDMFPIYQLTILLICWLFFLLRYQFEAFCFRLTLLMRTDWYICFIEILIVQECANAVIFDNFYYSDSFSRLGSFH